ncbi:MAG TPA: glycosyltransferase family 2 protein, partial [Gemmobacter sp.]|nr:glycosyltransferase family 2 protein [Gemmobacter sp.]
MTITVFTCMRNEGPFLLEWLAYHRLIGVTDF